MGTGSTKLHLSPQTTWCQECPKLQYSNFIPLQDAILCHVCFSGRGKKTAFTVWKSYPTVIASFLQPATTRTSSVSEACMEHLKRFVVLIYDRTSNKTNVNEARKQLLAQKFRAYDDIPPTRTSLLQHTNRAAYLAGHCWSLSPDPPSPGDWRWIFKEGNGSLSGQRFQT